MDTLVTSFYLFASLTAGFALALLWWILRKVPQVHHDAEVQTQAVKAIQMGAGAEATKAFAESIVKMLNALSDFGARLDSFGPIATLGVFTVIFALLTAATGWLGRH